MKHIEINVSQVRLHRIQGSKYSRPLNRREKEIIENLKQGKLVRLPEDYNCSRRGRMPSPPRIKVERLP